MNKDPEHMRKIARARWDGTTPAERSAGARAGLLAASVTNIERNAESLTGAQVDRILTALCEVLEGAGNA